MLFSKRYRTKLIKQFIAKYRSDLELLRFPFQTNHNRTLIERARNEIGYSKFTYYQDIANTILNYLRDIKIDEQTGERIENA